MAEESREVREVKPVWEAEVPWVVSYLREDIQDLRNEVREVRRSVQRLEEKVDEGLERLDEKIDARTDGLRQDMDMRFRWTLTTMVAVGALIVAAMKLLP
jgi:signal transduction histidine kinase